MWEYMWILSVLHSIVMDPNDVMKVGWMILDIVESLNYGHYKNIGIKLSSWNQRPLIWLGAEKWFHGSKMITLQNFQPNGTTTLSWLAICYIYPLT